MLKLQRREVVGHVGKVGIQVMYHEACGRLVIDPGTFQLPWVDSGKLFHRFQVTGTEQAGNENRL